MTENESEDPVARLASLSAYEAGWDGRSAAAANPSSFVLATAFAVEAERLGLRPEASLHANGMAVLSFGEGPRRASVQFHPDGIAGAFANRDGEEWDEDVRVDDPGARMRLAARINDVVADGGA